MHKITFPNRTKPYPTVKLPCRTVTDPKTTVPDRKKNLMKMLPSFTFLAKKLAQVTMGYRYLF